MRVSVESPFSWPMTQTGIAAEAAEAADDGLVLAELAVAGERRELVDQRVAIRQEMGPLRMTGDKRLLPRRQRRVELLQRRRRLGLEASDIVRDGHGIVVGAEGAQFLELGFQLGDRLFEIEIAAHHA